jgi:hypothetical protein
MDLNDIELIAKKFIQMCREHPEICPMIITKTSQHLQGVTLKERKKCESFRGYI